jgi:hypothetical protein
VRPATGQHVLGHASGLAQRTTQLQAAPQSMSAQAWDPEQSTARPEVTASQTTQPSDPISPSKYSIAMT